MTEENNEIHTYDQSPDKAVMPEESAAQTSETENKTEQGNIFGKFRTMEDAEKGYKSASEKIRQQGTEMSQLKKDLESKKRTNSYGY